MYASYGGWFNKKVKGLPDPCHIAVDIQHVFSDTMPNVFIQCEPRCIMDHRNYLKDHYHRYDFILTYDTDILKYPNARPYIYGTTWIPRDYVPSISTKQARISNSAGTKSINGAPGHLLRQYIHHTQSKIKTFSGLPVTFYRSSKQQPHVKDYGGNPLIGDSKLVLFETYQFAIVIENSKQHGYFTEKIMDCLLTKTIPIYWGCPNIGDYFDTTGWIMIPDSDHLSDHLSDHPLSVLTSLDKDYYARYTEIIEANYNRAMLYTDIYENLSKAFGDVENDQLASQNGQPTDHCH